MFIIQINGQKIKKTFTLIFLHRLVATGKESKSDGKKKGKNRDGGKGVHSGAVVRNLMLLLLQLSAERRLTGGHIGADGSAAEVHLGDVDGRLAGRIGGHFTS